MVEFSVVAPLLFLLFVAAAQTGYIIYTRLQIETTAREASRAAALAPVESQAFTATGAFPSSTITPNSFGPCTVGSSNPACNAAYNAAGWISSANLAVTITGTGTNSGSSIPNGLTECQPPAATQAEPQDGVVTVTVQTPVPIFVPLIGNFFGGTSHNFSSTVSTRVEPCFFTAGEQ